MFLTCFQLYFYPIYVYFKRALGLAAQNDGILAITTTGLISTMQLVDTFFQTELFGISNYLLLLVMLTILIDAYYGIKKSVKMSKSALRIAQTLDVTTPEYKRYMKIHQLRKFSTVKLQFTFFKALSLMGYLYFVDTLLSTDPDNTLGEVLGFTSAVILKVPLAIFWYYDFKSIGENAAYVYGKKAPIFVIAEKIFELKIKNHLNNGQNNT